jgi:hypothetical protein
MRGDGRRPVPSSRSFLHRVVDLVVCRFRTGPLGLMLYGMNSDRPHCSLLPYSSCATSMVTSTRRNPMTRT